MFVAGLGCLPVLRDSHTHSWLSTLQLVGLINKDYTEFVALSAKLEDFDAAVRRLRPPLVKVYERALRVQSAVVQYTRAHLEKKATNEQPSDKCLCTHLHAHFRQVPCSKQARHLPPKLLHHSVGYC